MNKTEAIQAVKILKALVEIGKASIISNTFLNSFVEKIVADENGQFYLRGSFNLGGTISGRLSSNNPNLMNIPSSGTKYAKPVKECIELNSDEWIIIGFDFDSLEDKISALTTKDPNKLRVYLEGFDGHCLRAFKYFGDQMPDIVDTVDSINSIKKKYPQIRQDSKAPTFLLTYGGTWMGMVNNTGFPKKKAKAIEKNYHELYAVADQWVQDRIYIASNVGYVDVAFGLRLRTPILHQTILGNSKTPYEAKKESRTAGNAMGQSYGLLNNRASIEFQEKVFDSPHIFDIRPIAHIHDAQYFIVKRDPIVVKWMNDVMVECLLWQELPELKHGKVKLGGSMEIYYPTWATSTKVKNNSSLTEITNILENL